jgi:checkpoint serine/threonine-protein kinase
MQRERQREKYRARLNLCDNEDDPLQAYDEFVQWTRKNYDGSDPDSGLLELLEEATRRFKDDPNYKMDLRYLKLWLLHARQVEEPAAIYAFLIANNIGTHYSVLYEQYADVLERSGR